jgi:Holliday junction DNA helicase RuvA
MCPALAIMFLLVQDFGCFAFGGEFTELHTEMLVSQDMIRLVGFASGAGTGMVPALANRAGGGNAGGAGHSVHPVGFRNCQCHCAAGQADDWPRAGVGKKLAERIVLELKDKAPAFTGADATLAKLQAELEAPRPTSASDAVSALVNLGYGQSQAGSRCQPPCARNGDDQPTEKLIRQALKELALL